jgi:glycine cleavage system H lipoate-binding protein
VYVELPEVGSTVTKGETFGVVESVKVSCSLVSFMVMPLCWQQHQCSHL